MGDRRMSGSVKVKTAMVDWKEGKSYSSEGENDHGGLERGKELFE